MKNKTVFNIVLTGSLVCGLVSTAVAKDILDVLGNTSPMGRTFMRSSVDQTYVYHTNGAMWMGWDSYGNTGDQTCSCLLYTSDAADE